MNQFVSLLTPGGQSGPVAKEHNFSNATARGKAAAPFSSLLERATYQAPERAHHTAKTTRPRPARTEDPQDEGLRSDRRPPMREKSKRDKTTEEHSLAGACAVNGQPVKPEAPVPSGEAPTESSEAEAATTILADGGEATVSIDGVATTTTTDGEATGVPSALTDGETVLPGTEDLAAALQPGSSTATITNPISTTPKPVTVGEVSLPLETDLSAATDASVPQPTTPIDLSAVPTAASAREAEVLLATSSEIVAGPVAPATVEAVVTTAIAPEEARRATRAARASWAETLEKASGTGGAKSSETMKTAIKKEEVAGVAQQLLPGAAPVAVSTLPTLPGEARSGALGAVSSAEAINQIGKLTPAPAHTEVAGTEKQLDVRATSPLLRVSELISREVRMFKRGGDDLVEVVLTPDAKTQISLRLQWREGQVEVQARCDLGDYQSLNTQWPQLQASLANHGVRLSHLSERVPTGFTEFFSNPGFSQQKGGERQAAHSGGPEPTTHSMGSPAKAAPVQPGVRGNRRLESWA